MQNKNPSKPTGVRSGAAWGALQGETHWLIRTN
jgi:hypothetical protein